MITLSFPINLDNSDKDFINDLRREQSSMIRSAYNQAKKYSKEIEVRNILRKRFEGSLDSWFLQSAIKNGIGSFKADKALGVSKRIYSSVDFIRRSKGLITNQELKKSRLLPLYLIGESPSKGNRKFVFSHEKIIFKPFRGKEIHIQLPKIRKNWKKKWFRALHFANLKQLPITVSLTGETIHLTFKDQPKDNFKKIKNRYAGIDMNPNYIGVIIKDKEKVISKQLFSLSKLTGKGTCPNKLRHETIEIGHSVSKFLAFHQVDKVFIEELNFKQGNKGLGKNFNRLTTNQWKRNTFISILEKYYPKLYKVSAAYSSTIGNVLNQDLPDPVAAASEIADRGYRLVITKSKKFYPELPSKGYIEDLWKKTDVPDFSSWKELHSWIKNLGLKYRVPIDVGFRIFKSNSSGIRIYNFT